jgi:hypothetical protein
MIFNTGVRASAEDIELARVKSHEVRTTPFIRVMDKWMPDVALESFQTWLDGLAVRYGLPEPGLVDGDVNHYGMTPDGEFNRYEPDGGNK